MRKKLLMMQNDDLFNRLQRTTLELERLRKENSRLNDIVVSLNDRLDICNAKIEEYKNNAVSEITLTVGKSESEGREQTHQAADTTVTNEPVQKITEVPVLSDDMIFGSEIIGDIVVDAARCSNDLAAMGRADAKELINLTLGKSEVAKAEILNIISSDVDFETKKQLMLSQKQEAQEYFKSILAQ